MGTPHKHAEVIKAWADGAEIQAKLSNGEWSDWTNPFSPGWGQETEYRVKPKEPRRFWINVYPHKFCGPYSSKETADLRNINRIECIEVVEVIK